MQTHRQFAMAPQMPQGTCRWCQKAITKPDGSPDLRRRWHPDCVEAYLVRRNPMELRKYVFLRDRGLCAGCGADTLADFLERHPDPRIREGIDKVPMAKVTAWRFARYMGSEWAADHIVPLKDGGSFELHNVQTLCTPCHKVKTGEENRIRFTKPKPPPAPMALLEAAG